MGKLNQVMPEAEFKIFAEKRMFFAWRSDHLYGGNFMDQLIEQCMVSLLKVNGGITHGRGITDSTLATFKGTLPKCITICAAFEEFAGVNSSTSDQHRDLRPEPVRLSQKHIKLFADFFAAHPAFPCHHSTLIDISTGVVGAPNINCDDTFEVGRAAVTKLVGAPFTDIKMKRGDRVINMAAKSAPISNHCCLRQSPRNGGVPHLRAQPAAAGSISAWSVQKEQQQ